MGQLVVRNLPDAVKARLKRRAKYHGRSLEAEVRDILNKVPEAETVREDEGTAAVTRLIERQREIGITSKDVDSLNESVAELRKDRRLRDVGTSRK